MASGEISADTDKLNKVRGALDDQRQNVQSAKKGLVAPSHGAFGASATGEWIEQIVHRAHLGLERALTENEQGLEKQSDAVHNGMKQISGADVDAQLQARALEEVVSIFSNPLVMFSNDEMAKLRNVPRAI